MNDLVKIQSEYIEKTNKETIKKLENLINDIKFKKIFVTKITESFGFDKKIIINLLEVK